MISEYKQFLHLLYCAANNIEDKKVIEKYDMDTMYDICKISGLTSFVDFYLENNHMYYENFSEMRDKVIAYTIMVDKEVERITELFEEKHIFNIPTKGIAIKNLYPGMGTREYGDVDIYIDKKDKKEVASILKAEGFEPGGVITNYDDGYCKDLVNIEMHYAFIGGGLNKYWKKFNKQAVKNATKVSEYQYDLSIEDHFIYLIMHAYKHHIEKGVGIRFLLDIWYYSHRYPQQTQSDYVQNTLHDLEIDEYAKNALELSEIVFSKGINNYELNSSQELELILLITNGPTQGANRDGQIIADRREVLGKGWISIYFYALKQLKENDKWYAFHYPFAYHHKWARPFVLLHASIQKVLNNPLGVLLEYDRK